MDALSGAGLLRVWEAGQAQHPVDRALTVLAAAGAGGPRARLAALPLPERDRRLLRARQALLGPALGAFAVCPACAERVEFSVDSRDLVPPEEQGGGPWEAEGGGVAMRFRLPDSRDLAAAARAAGVDGARRRLAERCVLEARGAEGPVPPGALPGAALDALARRMAEVAPHAELSFALACPACGTEWRAELDVAAFFWAELAARARRLLREVDGLARAYHWSEGEILALSPARRRAYLELAGA
ncbi:MAG TPA: hypothetical protein VFQ45_22030 [Longimicrobium sp.]|nr:hypothetical protein [Longimicrobium sp.]